MILKVIYVFVVDQPQACTEPLGLLCPSYLILPIPSEAAGGYALITSCLFILAGPAAEALFQLRLSTPLMWFSCILECRG